jgi:signal transduction histidine kinase
MSAVNHQLTARSRYFDAINDLNRHLKPGTAVVDILEHIARSVRIALDLPSVIVYRADFEKRFLEATLAGESKTATELFELRSSGEPLSDTDKSGFLLDPPGYLEPVITHYARKLGPGNIKLVRLISADRPIGGILFACEDSLADHILNEKQEVESLTTACSLALGQSLILDAKERLADDLLAVNRQMHELEQKLLETRCMAALGELAAGAAHELNNPLAIISGRAQLLRDQEKEPETRKALDIVIEQTHNASEIISDLMEFAKPVKPQRQNIILPEMLRSVVDDFVHRRQLNPGQITVDIKEGVSTVYADQQQLGAIVKELLDNAFEASNAADLRIKIRSVAEEESRYIQIRVADNGPGMEPEVLDKAMDLFFSSRKAGRKRGVGLARAYRYAQANDGMFWLDSHLGMGTTAYIRLPSRPFGQNTADQ